MIRQGRARQGGRGRSGLASAGDARGRVAHGKGLGPLSLTMPPLWPRGWGSDKAQVSSATALSRAGGRWARGFNADVGWFEGRGRGGNGIAGGGAPRARPGPSGRGSGGRVGARAAGAGRDLNLAATPPESRWAAGLNPDEATPTPATGMQRGCKLCRRFWAPAQGRGPRRRLCLRWCPPRPRPPPGAAPPPGGLPPRPRRLATLLRGRRRRRRQRRGRRARARRSADRVAGPRGRAPAAPAGGPSPQPRAWRRRARMCRRLRQRGRAGAVGGGAVGVGHDACRGGGGWAG
jgi:hypothetical protein